MEKSLQLHKKICLTANHGLRPSAMVRVKEYIESNIGEHLTLDTLADAACLSSFHFARMFRKSMGASPMTYVVSRRIEHAKSMLRNRDTNLSNVAAELGFCDHSHFTRIFRRNTGLTPKEYIKQYVDQVSELAAHASAVPSNFTIHPSHIQ